MWFCFFSVVNSNNAHSQGKNVNALHYLIIGNHNQFFKTINRRKRLSWFSILSIDSTEELIMNMNNENKILLIAEVAERLRVSQSMVGAKPQRNRQFSEAHQRRRRKMPVARIGY